MSTEVPPSRHADASPAATNSDVTTARRVARACLIGTSIEWYDFNIYGTAAALVFARQFFPSFSPLAGTLAALGTFGVGFIARPIGGVVMGHFGDRYGRKSMLVTSLLTMGVATFCVGLLPTYATIGLAAPLLLTLLRFAQGFGVGGEWGGAVLMAVEHAPRGKRTVYSSSVQLGLPIGNAAAVGVFLLLLLSVGPQPVADWAWRVPFLLGGVLVVVGLLMRLRLQESPDFRRLDREQATSHHPLREVLSTERRTLLLAGLACTTSPALGYLLFVYLVGYGHAALGVSTNLMLTLAIVACAVLALLLPYVAAVCERRGRKPVFVAGFAFTAVWSLPFFALLDTASLPLMVLAYVGAGVAMAGMTGPQAALVADLFPARMRYSGASIAYQAGSILGGALAPIIASALFAATGGSFAIGLYVLGLAVVSLLAALALPEPSSHFDDAARSGTHTP